MLGLCWILGSDYLLDQLFADSAARSAGQQFKGLFFIAATGVVLFFVLRRTNAVLVAAAKRAAESDLKNEDLFEHHPTPMWVYDALTGGFLAVNDAAIHRYGFSEQEFLKLTLLDIRPVEDVPAFVSTRTSVTPKGYGDAGVWRHKTKSGEVMHMHITLNRTTYRGRDGMCVMAREVTREVESRQALETLNNSLEERVAQRTAELQTANQELDAFARSAAHDLRTPLNGILGFTQILQHDISHSKADRQLAALDQIQRSAKSTLGLIDGLLVMSRAAHKALVIEDVDLSTLASLSIEQLRNANPGHCVDSHVQSGLNVQGDPALLFSLLSNLLSNAWKYSRNRGDARIEFGSQVLPDGSRVYFVLDNGVGFSMDKADRLFKPFQRLHSEREFEGNGVGLVTCQRICRKHAISAATWYAWKSKYAGATVSDLTRMREFEIENAKLKRMYRPGA